MNESLRLIFEHLDARALAMCAATCCSWRRVARQVANVRLGQKTNVFKQLNETEYPTVITKILEGTFSTTSNCSQIATELEHLSTGKWRIDLSVNVLGVGEVEFEVCDYPISLMNRSILTRLFSSEKELPISMFTIVQIKGRSDIHLRYRSCNGESLYMQDIVLMAQKI
jgi:F-box-like